ncbi:MAG: acyl-CoA dehydrogenase family protein [Polyangiales bacterium]
MPPADPDLLARARAAAETIAPLAAETEAARRLPPSVVDALARAGVFKLLVPRAYGGAEASASTLVAVIEAIATADGSAGWCAMIGASSGLMSVHLDDALAREVFGADDAVTCGVFAPMGRATATADGAGYRVSGRWPFASGCQHSPWRMGGAIVVDAQGAPSELLPAGTPDVRSVLFRADETTVVETWDVSGLRGTGSHDLAVTDVMVPAARTFSLLTGRPRHDGAVYRLPFFGVLAAGVAAVTIGLATAAVDALSRLARTKQPLGARRGLAHRELVQLHVVQAEAKTRAARAFLREALEEVELAAAAGEVSLQSRATLRIAAAHAARECAAAVDLAYHAGGATSIYAKHPLQRHFRDVHVATQHVMVADVSAILAGRVRLGVESDVTTL